MNIAWQCHMLPQQVSSWFSNRRCRSKKGNDSENTQNRKVDDLETEKQLQELEEAEVQEPAPTYEQILVPFPLDYNMWNVALNGAEEESIFPDLIEDFVPPDENFF